MLFFKPKNIAVFLNKMENLKIWVLLFCYIYIYIYIYTSRNSPKELFFSCLTCPAKRLSGD